MLPAAYRIMKPGEEGAAYDLIMASFMEFVGHEYPPEGVTAFSEHAGPEGLLAAAQRGRALVATVGDEIVGVVRLRASFAHINLLFVDRRFHRRGIARELVRRAVDLAASNNPGLDRVTVNSSRYAVPVYERLGFSKTGGEQTVDGITFIPMALQLGRGGT